MATTSALTVLYPGSFDPIHNGHLDVVAQAAELFGTVVVAVMHNPDKPSGLVGLEARVDLARASTAHIAGVRVEAHPGLAVQAAAATGADFIVKGLRTAADFEVEQQMAHTNHSVSGVRTVYLPCRADHAFISSRFIREIAQYGGRIDHMVPAPVAAALAGIFGRPSGGSQGRA
ncbi:MAG: pantetheine-phosphate adenylyltransferase [Acidimicrobiia bacterium]